MAYVALQLCVYILVFTLYKIRYCLLCQAWKDAGLELSTSSDEAARMLDAAITQFASSVKDETIGGIENSIKRLKDADPTFGMILLHQYLIVLLLKYMSSLETN
jgi:hypothetical protein